MIASADVRLFGKGAPIQDLNKRIMSELKLTEFLCKGHRRSEAYKELVKSVKAQKGRSLLSARIQQQLTLNANQTRLLSWS